ncbi:MAG: hypothetical protein KAG84_00865 [Bacteroidales bacterium]|nr:hypothetical protein [Bacteroidales bacterium]
MIRITLVLIFIAAIKPVRAQFYTGSQMEFGKNRIQYTNDKRWSYYRFNNFDTYYYKESHSLAIYASAYADKQMVNISNRLDFKPDNKIRFVIFKDLSDLKETNIGLITGEQYNVGGVTHVINNKVFVFFNGNHRDFEIQIKKGIAKVYLNELLYGGSAGARIKSSILLAFPSWYTDGLVSYLADGWNTELDGKMREGIKTKSFKKFDRLTNEEQLTVGHSLWKYIDLKYGSKTVADVLYMAKVNRNIENGFLYVLGLSYEEIFAEWFSFYERRYKHDNEKFTEPQNSFLKRNKEKIKYNNSCINADGDLMAYVSNESGKVRVIIQDIESGKKRKIMKYGYKLDEKVDYHYPLLSWSPQGNYLGIIYEKKKDNFFVTYDYDNKKSRKKVLGHFDRVQSFSYNKRGNKLAVSAVKNGQSDIYIVSVAGNSYKRITQDAFDDTYPRFVNNSNALVWSSNRIDDTLRVIKQRVHRIAEDTIRGQKYSDLFFYNLQSESNVLHRITNTPLSDEKYVMPIAYNTFAWLSDENGIYNRYIGRFDSTISFIDTATHYRYYTKYFATTNYNSNILEQEYSTYSGKYTEVVEVDGHTKIFVNEIPDLEDYSRMKLASTTYMTEETIKLKRIKERERLKSELLLKIAEGDTSHNVQKAVKKLKPKKKKRFGIVTIGQMKNPKSKSVDINNYNFNGGAQKDNSSQIALKSARERGPADAIRAAYNSRPYNVSYDVSQVVSQVNFNYLNYGYQPFTNPRTPIYITNNFSALIKLGIMDLFEDYRLVGGVNIKPNLKNNEYFLTFSDYKNRIDKDYTFHRNIIESYGARGELVLHQIHEVFVKVGIPINNVKGFRVTLGMRNDNAVTKAFGTAKSLAAVDVMTNNAILRGEYVFDNTRNGGSNILFGSRYKLFGEYYQPMENLQNNLFVVGFDFRKYIQIHKTFVWANRIAGSSSFGEQRLIYYMGGVDNWLFAEFNDNIQVDSEQDFIYQTLATNMRGFRQNIRNGNNFFLINSELRLPPIKYFSPKPVKSAFWNDFMIIGFADVGTAWTGPNPFSDKNALFRKSIYQNPVEITIINQDDPIVGSYGFGLRSTLFGYYVRADWAWGVVNGIPAKKPMFNFSLSLDF